VFQRVLSASIFSTAENFNDLANEQNFGLVGQSHPSFKHELAGRTLTHPNNPSKKKCADES